MRRIRTNIPLQALVTMNDPVFVEASGSLAKAVLASSLSTDDQRIAYAFRRVLVRPPSDQETKRLGMILNEGLTEFNTDPDSATELLNSARIEADGFEKEQLAAWTIVSNVLLNLDETLMRN